MTTKYSDFRLGDVLISLKTGLNPRSNFTLNGVDAQNWYITVRELNGIGVDFLPQTDKVTDDGLRRINNRSNLEIGDILFSGTGTIGKTALIQETPHNWNIKEGVYALKPNKDLVDPYYLLCILRFYSTTNIFTRQMGGSTVFSIPMQVLADTKIALPSLSEQVRVSTMLKEIDDKIALNDKMNTELNDLIDTVYNYWFVQFDFPNHEGLPYRSSGGKIEQHGNGKLMAPVDWKVESIGALIGIKKGISYTSEEILHSDGIPMINLGSIDKNRTYRDEKIKYFSGSVANDRLLRPGDMLLACTDLTSDGLIIGCPIFVPGHHDLFTFSMDLARIDIKSPKILSAYLYKTLRTEWYHNYIKRFSSGTNVRHLDISGVLDYKIALPPVAIQEQFEKITKPMFDKINESLIENQRLATMRDWLLPMLVTGQVRVD